MRRRETAGRAVAVMQEGDDSVEYVAGVRKGKGGEFGGRLEPLPLLPPPQRATTHPGHVRLALPLQASVKGTDKVKADDITRWAADLGLGRALQAAAGAAVSVGDSAGTDTGDAPTDVAGVAVEFIVVEDFNLGADAGARGEEAYQLSIRASCGEDDAGGITIEAGGAAGLWYGLSTLQQWVSLADPSAVRLRGAGGGGEGGIAEAKATSDADGGAATAPAYVDVPAAVMRDWPDFAARGVMLDVSRDRIPTMDTLFMLVRRLAAMKVNQFQLYFEHAFAYEGHEDVWDADAAFTGEQIRQLDQYCRDRFIELVPNQNSFGHMAPWLRTPGYTDMAECPEGFPHPFAREPEPFSFCPTDPRSAEFMDSLYEQLLPHFSSTTVNVGLDETFDLGRGRSAAACAERGQGVVYLEFLLEIYRRISARGLHMQYWGDIIEHYPELVPRLPKNATALIWGYGAHYPFAKMCGLFEKNGIPFYVVPGTSSWNSFGGRTSNTIANLQNAAVHGHAQGGLGFLNADWGDNGHLNPLAASYLGFAVGAAFGWNAKFAAALLPADGLNCDNNGPAVRRELKEWTVRVLNDHVLRDRTGAGGSVLYDLGDTYLRTGSKAFNNVDLNGTLLFYLTLVPETLMQELLHRLCGFVGHGRPVVGRIMWAVTSRPFVAVLTALLIALVPSLVLFLVTHLSDVWVDHDVDGWQGFGICFAACFVVTLLYTSCYAFTVLGRLFLRFSAVRSSGLDDAAEQAHRAGLLVDGMRPACDDDAVVKREMRWIADVLAVSARLSAARARRGLIGLHRLPEQERLAFAGQLDELVARHRALWAERDRGGAGLEASEEWLLYTVRWLRRDFRPAAVVQRNSKDGDGGVAKRRSSKTGNGGEAAPGPRDADRV